MAPRGAEVTLNPSWGWLWGVPLYWGPKHYGGDGGMVMGGEGTPKNEHFGIDTNSTQSITRKQRPKMAPRGAEVTLNPNGTYRG